MLFRRLLWKRKIFTYDSLLETRCRALSPFLAWLIMNHTELYLLCTSKSKKVLAKQIFLELNRSKQCLTVSGFSFKEKEMDIEKIKSTLKKPWLLSSVFCKTKIFRPASWIFGCSISPKGAWKSHSVYNYKSATFHKH